MSAAALVKLWLAVRPIQRWKQRKAMKGKVTYIGIAGLAIQGLASAFGVDIAPAELDAVLLAVNAAIAAYGRWRATRA